MDFIAVLARLIQTWYCYPSCGATAVGS